MAHEHKTLSDDPVVRGHETSDADAKAVTISGVVLSFGFMIIGVVLSWGVYAYFKGLAPVPDAPPETVVVPNTATAPPLPRLQADPHVELVPFVADQEALLNSYGIASKDSGYARIPIADAMKAVVQQGLPQQPEQ